MLTQLSVHHVSGAHGRQKKVSDRRFSARANALNHWATSAFPEQKSFLKIRDTSPSSLETKTGFQGQLINLLSYQLYVFKEFEPSLRTHSSLVFIKILPFVCCVLWGRDLHVSSAEQQVPLPSESRDCSRVINVSESKLWISLHLRLYHTESFHCLLALLCRFLEASGHSLCNIMYCFPLSALGFFSWNIRQAYF